MNREDLLATIHRFYPRGIARHEPGYAATEEHRRLVSAARRAVDDYEVWSSMLGRLARRFSVQNESLFLLAGGVDPAYSAYVILATQTLGFHVSLLGPYYAVHRPGAVDEEPAATEVEAEIVATYPGYQPIAVELGEEKVADVDGAIHGAPTIYECLFSENWNRYPFSVAGGGG